MALISPPVALNLVVIKHLTKAPSMEIDKAATPYKTLDGAGDPHPGPVPGHCLVAAASHEARRMNSNDVDCFAGNRSSSVSLDEGGSNYRAIA